MKQLDEKESKEFQEFLDETIRDSEIALEKQLSRLELGFGFMRQFRGFLEAVKDGSFEPGKEYSQCSHICEGLRIGEEMCFVNLFRFREGDKSFGDMFRVIVFGQIVQIYKYDEPRDVFCPSRFHEEFKPVTYTIDQCGSLIDAIKMGIDHFSGKQEEK